MNALYMLVYELKKNMDGNKVDIQKDVVLQIAKQTTECCYFIRSYASDDDFGGHKVEALESSSLTCSPH